MIDQHPRGGGWRYFLRAAIYYEQGQKDLALQDIETGDMYTWYNVGVYWYVQAKMAFDADDMENYILYLKNTERTLEIGYTPLRQQILEELRSRGEKPDEPTINLPFTVVPIQ